MNEPQSPMAGTRQDADSVMKQRVRRLEIEARQMKALIEEMPEDLSKDAEEALWRLLTAR